jgi:methylase of polypeptide subunit release factors
MKKKITIYLEFGENQKNDIEKTIHDTIKTAKTTFFKDLQGKDRYVRIVYEY